MNHNDLLFLTMGNITVSFLVQEMCDILSFLLVDQFCGSALNVIHPDQLIITIYCF